MTRGPEQRELDRLSRSNERLESELAKCKLALEIQKASERYWSGCWPRAKIRGAAVIESQALALLAETTGKK